VLLQPQRNTAQVLKQTIQQDCRRRKYRSLAPGCIEDAFEARTTLAGLFSILPVWSWVGDCWRYRCWL